MDQPNTFASTRINSLLCTLKSAENNLGPYTQLSWSDQQQAYLFTNSKYSGYDEIHFQEDLAYITKLMKTASDSLESTIHNHPIDDLKDALDLMSFRLKVAIRTCPESLGNSSDFKGLEDQIQRIICLADSIPQIPDSTIGQAIRPKKASPTTRLEEMPIKLVASGQNYLQHLQSCFFDPEIGVIIDNNLLLDAFCDCQNAKAINKIALKNVNNYMGAFKNTTNPFGVSENLKWTGLSFHESAPNTIEASIEASRNSTIPTSLRDDKNPANNDLANFKMQIDPSDNHICISCGAIDTAKKSQEFVAGLFEALDARTAIAGAHLEMPPVRIVLHQLNSYWTDGQLIPKQHIQSRDIEQQLQEYFAASDRYQSIFPTSPAVAHINCSINKATVMPGEDSASNLYNLDGLCALVLWFMEDLYQAPPENMSQELLLHVTKDLSERLQEIKTLKNSIATANDLKSDVSYQLPILQDLMLKSLQQVTSCCHKFANIDIGNKPTPKQCMAKNKATALAILIGKQTKASENIIKISRNQEIELSLIIDMMLNTITEMNCKSGLDRTGLVRSLWDSLKIMKDKYTSDYLIEGFDPEMASAMSFKRLIDFVINQDALQPTLDKIYESVIKKLNPKIAVDLNSAIQMSSSANEEGVSKIFRLSLLEAIDNHSVDSEKNNLKDLVYYQDLVCTHMFKIAQSVTLESTGAVGLKYGHTSSSVSGNPHPLKRLPMFVTTADGTLIQMYNLKYTLLGNETNMLSLGAIKHYFTPAGLSLIERLSQKRGS